MYSSSGTGRKSVWYKAACKKISEKNYQSPKRKEPFNLNRNYTYIYIQYKKHNIKVQYGQREMGYIIGQGNGKENENFKLTTLKTFTFGFSL